MRKRRVGLVVTELLGLVKTGGIATATTHMAIVLSRAGYDVECIYCGWTEKMDPEWEPLYRDAGVSIRRLDRSHDVSPATVADSYRLYHMLKGDEFDVLVFQDWQGLGFCSATAKRAGLAFGSTRLVHIVHGPVDWLDEANRSLGTDLSLQIAAWMERCSAELSDTVVGPSRYLVGWMTEQGWDLPNDQRFIPYLTAGHVDDLDLRPEPRPGNVGAPLTEIVFFGRLEERKGVRIFADALARIGADRVRGLTITFLGRDAMFTGDEVCELLPSDVLEAASVRFLTDLDQRQARAHLAQPGVLAVMPSILDNSPNVVYECIEDAIPFLVSAGGGSAELVSEADRESCVFEPTGASLAERLGAIVDSRVAPAPPQPAFSGRASFHALRELIDTDPNPVVPAVEARTPPLVSVVVPHFNQFSLVRHCLDSIAAQDYPNLEIVLVDDGSSDPNAEEQLAALEEWQWGRELRVIRQENRYLGAARNRGVAEASGEIVAFVDDDDQLAKDYVSTMVTALLTSGADVVSSAIAMYPTDHVGPIPMGAHEGTWAFLGGAVHLGSMLNVFGGAAIVGWRTVLAESGGYHERKGVGHEDWTLLARLALAGHRVVAVPEAGYRYRVRAGSMIRSTTTWSNMQPVFDAYGEHVPEGLRRLVRIVRGLADELADARAEAGSLQVQIGAYEQEIGIRDRYLGLLRLQLGLDPIVDIDEDGWP